jgi:ankyrin repeat protein
MVIENIRDVYLEAPIGRLGQSSFAILKDLARAGDFDGIVAFGQILASETGADPKAPGFAQAKSLLELLRMQDVPAWLRIYCMALVPRELVKHAAECANLRSEIETERNLHLLRQLIARGSPLQHEMLKCFPLMLACRMASPGAMGLGDNRTILRICDKVWSTCRVVAGNNATADLEVGEEMITNMSLSCAGLCGVLAHEIGHIILDTGGKQQQFPDSVLPTASTLRAFVSALPSSFQKAAKVGNQPIQPNDDRKTRFDWGLSLLCTSTRLDTLSYFHLSLMQDFGPIDFEAGVTWCYLIASTFAKDPNSAALVYSQRGMIHLGIPETQLLVSPRIQDSAALLPTLVGHTSSWLEVLHRSLRFSNSEQDMAGMLGAAQRIPRFYGLDRKVAFSDLSLRWEHDPAGEGIKNASAFNGEERNALMRGAVRCVDAMLASLLSENGTPLPPHLSELGYSVCMIGDGMQNAYYGPSVDGVFEFVKMSHKLGVSVDAPVDGSGSTLLMQAAPRSVGMARLLLEHGADVNAARTDGDTALILAAACGTVSAVRQLIEHGASLEARNGSGMTALNEAVLWDNSDVADLLLQHGAEPDTAVMYSQTPAMIRLLHRHGADMDAGSPSGETALMLAASRHKTELMATLLDCGARPDAYTDLGRTPLHYAMQSYDFGDQLPCVQMLVERGADVNDRTRGEDTPLTMAITRGAVKTVRWMLQHGARIDAVDGKGNTPLLRAVMASTNTEIVELLVESGADITHKNLQGETALNLASKDILPLLQPAKGKEV